MAEKYDEFAKYIRQARHRTGLDQSQLAELLGMGQTSIANWEGGWAIPRLDRVPALAKALEVPVEELTKMVEEVLSRRVRSKVESSTVNRGQAIGKALASRYEALEVELEELKQRVAVLESRCGIGNH